jgi:hypothetical protein
MASAICDPPFRSNDGGMNDGRSVGLAPLPWMQLDRQARRYQRGLYSPEETNPELGGRRAIGAPLLPTLSPPLILLTSAWRKERIKKGRNLMETNPGGPRRVRLLLFG